MKKKRGELAELEYVRFSFVLAMIFSVVAFFATLIALVNPNLLTITGFLSRLYGAVGYDVSTLGLILGAVYSFVDVFTISFVLLWLKEKLKN